MPWHKIPLTESQVAQGRILQIQFASQVVYRGQAGVALFLDATPGNVALYFTPLTARLCADLIRQHGGYPCPEPSLRATLLWGDPSYYPAERTANASQASHEPDTDDDAD